MKLNELENKNIDIFNSVLSLQIRNYIDNQFILKILSEKFDIDLNSHQDSEEKWREQALDLLSITDK